MTRKEFVKLVKLANLRPDLSRPKEYESLMGLALHQERRMVSEGGAIAFVRYQALQWNGTWDMEELENLQYCFRRVDIVKFDKPEPIGDLTNHFEQLYS